MTEWLDVSEISNIDLLEWELEWLEKQKWITAQDISSILYEQSTAYINGLLWNEKVEINNIDTFANVRRIIDRIAQGDTGIIANIPVIWSSRLDWIPERFKEDTLYPGANEY